jgi:hypothetical protein
MDEFGKPSNSDYISGLSNYLQGRYKNGNYQYGHGQRYNSSTRGQPVLQGGQAEIIFINRSRI